MTAGVRLWVLIYRVSFCIIMDPSLVPSPGYPGICGSSYSVSDKCENPRQKGHFLLMCIISFRAPLLYRFYRTVISNPLFPEGYDSFVSHLFSDILLPEPETAATYSGSSLIEERYFQNLDFTDYKGHAASIPIVWNVSQIIAETDPDTLPVVPVRILASFDRDTEAVCNGERHITSGRFITAACVPGFGYGPYNGAAIIDGNHRLAYAAENSPGGSLPLLLFTDRTMLRYLLPESEKFVAAMFCLEEFLYSLSYS